MRWRALASPKQAGRTRSSSPRPHPRRAARHARPLAGPKTEIGEHVLSTHPLGDVRSPRLGAGKPEVRGSPPNAASTEAGRRYGPLYSALSIASALETSTWPGCASMLSDLTTPLSINIA